MPTLDRTKGDGALHLPLQCGLSESFPASYFSFLVSFSSSPLQVLPGHLTDRNLKMPVNLFSLTSKPNSVQKKELGEMPKVQRPGFLTAQDKPVINYAVTAYEDLQSKKKQRKWNILTEKNEFERQNVSLPIATS